MLSYKREQMYKSTANVYTDEPMHLHFEDGSGTIGGKGVSLTLLMIGGYDDIKDA